MNHKVALLILTTLLFTACSTPQKKAPLPSAPPAPPAPAAKGGYLEGDGPGANAPANLDAIPDAEPKIEPLHRYANRPYTALGKPYTPLTTVGAFKQRGIASWYGIKFNGERTSSGEKYDMYAMSAAHPILPIPSYARVTNLANRKSVVVRINDRGPFINDRIIDLSYTAAFKLGIIGDGSAEVEVESIAANEGVKTITPVAIQTQPLDSGPPATPVTTPAASAVIAAPVAASASAEAPAAAPDLPVILDSKNNSVYLQLGAFKSQASAESFMSKMRNKLKDTDKQLKLTIKKGLVRVHFGPYANESEARSGAELLKGTLGFKPMVNLP